MKLYLNLSTQKFKQLIMNNIKIEVGFYFCGYSGSQDVEEIKLGRDLMEEERKHIKDDFSGFDESILDGGLFWKDSEAGLLPTLKSSYVENDKIVLTITCFPEEKGDIMQFIQDGWVDAWEEVSIVLEKDKKDLPKKWLKYYVDWEK